MNVYIVSFFDNYHFTINGAKEHAFAMKKPCRSFIRKCSKREAPDVKFLMILSRPD